MLFNAYFIYFFSKHILIDIMNNMNNLLPWYDKVLTGVMCMTNHDGYGNENQAADSNLGSHLYPVTYQFHHVTSFLLLPSNPLFLLLFIHSQFFHSSEVMALICHAWSTMLGREGCSVAKLCPVIGDPINCNTPGFPVFPHILEFAQTHVHWVSDMIQPSIHPTIQYCYKEKYCIGTWNVKSMNQGKLEVVK